MRCQGKVVRQQFGAGSKSEHQAVVLQTPDGPLKLRRPGRGATPAYASMIGRSASAGKWVGLAETEDVRMGVPGLWGCSFRIICGYQCGRMLFLHELGGP